MNKIATFLRESSPAKYLILIGLAIAVFGTITFVINSNNQDYIKIEATVVDVKEEEDIITDGDGNHTTTIYNATLKYVVKEQEYQQTLDNVSKHKVGDKMDIFYNPENPNQITQTKSLILPTCLIISGIILLVFGVINTIKTNKKIKA